MKKKILYLSPAVIDDNGWGVQRRGANHLKGLASSGEVHLVVLKLNADGSERIPEHLEALCASSRLIGVQVSPPQIALKLPLVAILNEYIQPSYRRNMPEEKDLQTLATFINEQAFDCIFCFRLRTAVILEELEKRGLIKPVKRKIVDFDDIESIAIQRERDNKREEAGFEYSQIQRLRVSRLKSQELRFINSFDSVLTCSDVDRINLESFHPKASIDVIPNSVSMPSDEVISQATSCEDGKFRILFVGTMSYLPNEDAVLWFVNDILPLIRQKASGREVDVTLVGFNPAQKVLDLGKHEGVTVTGGVPSVEPYYHKCDILISPIRFGGGTRIKLLEGFSYQKPFVSTTIGAEGIAVVDHNNVLLADDANSFADACIELMEDPQLASEIAKQGRELVKQHYTVEAIGEHLSALL